MGALDLHKVCSYENNMTQGLRLSKGETFTGNIKILILLNDTQIIITHLLKE